MAEEVLKVEEREIKSKSYLKNLRRNGKVPGVYYTHGKKATPIAIDLHDFKQKLSHQTNLFDLDFGKGRKKPSIIRELQYDPISGEIIHVDLMGVKTTEKVVIKVPINLVGTAVGVKEEGGVLEFTHRELEIECLPKDMPASIDVDVSGLRVNDSLHAADIQLENMTLISDGDTVIAHVLPPRVEREAPAAGVEEAEAIAEEESGEEKE